MTARYLEKVCSGRTDEKRNARILAGNVRQLYEIESNTAAGSQRTHWLGEPNGMH
jgi:hypothetical protein